MSAPEQGMVLASYRRVTLENKRGIILTNLGESGARRNTAKDLLNIFQESAPCLSGLRRQFPIQGGETEQHPAYDLHVKRLQNRNWREVDIAKTMPDDDAGAAWATLCLYEQMDGHMEVGNDRYGGIAVMDRRVEAEWDRVRTRKQERGHATLIEEANWERYSRTYMSLLLGRGYFEAGDGPEVKLPVSLLRLERERNNFYIGQDPDENAVMRMIGVCVTSEEFTDIWHEAEKQPSSVEGAQYLWNSGVFAPPNADPF